MKGEMLYEATFPSSAGSIASLKQTSMCVLSRANADRTIGAVTSGELLNTLFCIPGVPPAALFDAIQFPEEAHKLVEFGLMSSSVHPPSSFTASWYQARS